MQTFLPYLDFSQSASVLDRQRLGKQRVETMQIMNVLSATNEKKGWASHPAVTMWKGCECALMVYQQAMVEEWVEKRGYKDTCLQKTWDIHQIEEHDCSVILPKWIGNEDFHSSHRSNLLRKDPDFYSQFDWKEDPLKPYLWPSDVDDSGERFVVGKSVEED